MNGSPESWDAAEKAVMEALLSDRGLQNLVDVGARALGNPLVVVDPGHRYLACGGEAPDADDGSAYARVMREELAFGDILEEGSAYIEQERIDERLSRANGPLACRNDVLGLDIVRGREAAVARRQGGGVGHGARPEETDGRGNAVGGDGETDGRWFWSATARARWRWPRPARW